MKKVILTLRKNKLADYVLVNGENVTFVRNKKAKMYYAEYQTEDNQVTISFDTYNPLNKWHWWLFGTFFFIISIFGIFDWHISSRFVYQYQAIITLNEGDNVVNLIPLRGRGKVVNVETACGYDEIINNKDRPKKIKVRSTLLTLTKVLIILSVFVVGVVLAIMLLIAVLNKATLH